MHFKFFSPINLRFASVKSFFFAVTASVAVLGSGDLLAAPVISEFNPLWGTPGTQVTITGFGFSNATQVEFGGRPADFQINSENTLTAVVPPDGLTGKLAVTSITGAGDSLNLFYISPRIDYFSPIQGTSGTTVTINGENFLPNGTWVVFGSVTSLVVNVTAPTQLQATVPEGATNSIVYVHTGAGSATSIVEFISSTAPLITSFSPQNGLPGVDLPVSINGANLLGTTNVSFNGTNAFFSITAESQIRTWVPAEATTGKIRVGTTTGEAFSANDFIVAQRSITSNHWVARWVNGSLLMVTTLLA